MKRQIQEYHDIDSAPCEKYTFGQFKEDARTAAGKATARFKRAEQDVGDFLDYLGSGGPYRLQPAYAYAGVPSGDSPTGPSQDFPNIAYMSKKGRQNPGGVGDVGSHVQTASNIGLLGDAAVAAVTGAIAAVIAQGLGADGAAIAQAAVCAGVPAPLALRLAKFLLSHGHHEDDWGR